MRTQAEREAYLKKVQENLAKPKPVQDTNVQHVKRICSECGWREMSEKVFKFSMSTDNRPICWACQQKRTVK